MTRLLMLRQVLVLGTFPDHFFSHEKLLALYKNSLKPLASMYLQIFGPDMLMGNSCGRDFMVTWNEFE